MFDKLRLIAHIILVINFLLFLSKYKIGSNAYKIYSIYLGFIVLIEITIKLVVDFGFENLIFSHLYFTGQFILLSLFYLELLTEKYQKKIIKFNLILIPLILMVNFFINPSEIHKFSLLEILLTSISIISYCTFHFYNMLSNRKEFYLINCGIIIYLFGSTVTFLPRNLHVIYGYSFSMALHILNIILYIVYLIFIFLEWRNINLRINK